MDNILVNRSEILNDPWEQIMKNTINKYWIVLKINTEENNKFEICGLYDTKQKAIKRCKDWTYLIGPLFLNKDTPDESQHWKGAYYPIVRKCQIFKDFNKEYNP